MVASSGDEHHAPATDTAAAATPLHGEEEDVVKLHCVPVVMVGGKRSLREDDVASLVSTVEAASQDDAMHDVVAKIEEAAGIDVAFDAAATAAAVVPPPEAIKTDVGCTPGSVQDAVADAGISYDPSGDGATVKFDSKRMARVSFNSWFDFDSYFELYMQETFQPFRMRSSCSVEAYRRNQQKVMLNNKSSRGRRAEFPDEAIHHHRIYMCTHAMKARCRGANTRPGQKYRGIGCMAKINVKITPADNPSKYMVIVTDQVRTERQVFFRAVVDRVD